MRTLASIDHDHRVHGRRAMTDGLPHGPGLAMLVVPMPGSVRPPTDSAAAMLAWLVKHGAPRTADVLRRLQQQGWTIEPSDPDAASQTELSAVARFADIEQARIAARPYHGRVSDLMRWTPADRPADATLLAFAGQRAC
jgi:hypothetical protein